MALSDSSIKKLNNELSIGNHALETFRNETSQYLDDVSGDVNYSTFVSETEIGSELNTKLLTLIDIAKSVGNDIEKLLKTTQDFSDAQSRLNSYKNEVLGGTAGENIPTTITAGEVADHRVNSVVTNGTVTVPGGTRIPSSAITGGVE